MNKPNSNGTKKNRTHSELYKLGNGTLGVKRQPINGQKSLWRITIPSLKWKRTRAERLSTTFWKSSSISRCVHFLWCWMVQWDKANTNSWSNWIRGTLNESEWIRSVGIWRVELLHARRETVFFCSFFSHSTASRIRKSGNKSQTPTGPVASAHGIHLRWCITANRLYEFLVLLAIDFNILSSLTRSRLYALSLCVHYMRSLHAHKEMLMHENASEMWMASSEKREISTGERLNEAADVN